MNTTTTTDAAQEELNTMTTKISIVETQRSATGNYIPTPCDWYVFQREQNLDGKRAKDLRGAFWAGDGWTEDLQAAKLFSGSAPFAAIGEMRDGIEEGLAKAAGKAWINPKTNRVSDSAERVAIRKCKES